MSALPEKPRWRGLRCKEAGEAGLAIVDLLVALVLVVIACAIAIPAFVSETSTPTNTGAQANLETGLSGANVYWRATKGSFGGIYGGGSGVSSITGIDVALKFVQSASTKPNVISIASSGPTDWLVMTAFVPGTRDCWIVVAQAKPQTAAVAGNLDRAPGIYFGVIRRTESSHCVAGLRLAGTSFRAHHFPRGSVAGLHVGLRGTRTPSLSRAS
jgi:hypothetical protein